jgi:hypothetical protein
VLAAGGFKELEMTGRNGSLERAREIFSPVDMEFLKVKAALESQK